MHSPPSSSLFYKILDSIGDHVLTSNLVYLHVLLHSTTPLLHLQSRHRPRKGESYFILHLLNPYDNNTDKITTKITPSIGTQTKIEQNTYVQQQRISTNNTVTKVKTHKQ